MPRLSEDCAAIVLAGGQGTRLRSVLPDRQKVLAPIGGRPCLAWILDRVAAAGIQTAVLCTGHLAAQVREALGERHGRLSLRYSEEAAPLGTGGALRLALRQTDARTLVVLNGDSVSEVDVAAVVRRQRQRRARCTLVLARVPDTRAYGLVRVGRNCRVLGFQEKGGVAGPGWVYAGIAIVARELLAAAPAGRACSLERELLPRWAGLGLEAYRTRRAFLDIGTPAAYAAAAHFCGAFREAVPEEPARE
jgi:D-glycero-alpha-D-manno-heptose 1-phosphate guanylyltransferase